MAEQYRSTLGVAAHVVHNVMPRSSAPAAFDVPSGALKLYWFSQTVGAGRGLEDIITGVALAGIDAELHLRGSGGEAFVEQLRHEARAHGARVTIVLHPPAAADDMVALCRDHAIGLAVEQPNAVNRDLCVTNKILTYLSAGLAVVATSTQGHRYVAQHAPGAIACYAADDPADLAATLKRWHDDRAALACARQASWRAGQERFYWEHPMERGVLVEALERAIG
jgi:hypothetical protein